MDRRTQISLAVAIGLHAVVLVAARRCVAGHGPAHEDDARQAEIEVETLPPEPSGEPSEQPGAQASEPLPPTPTRQRAERPSTQARPSERASATDGTLSVTPEPPVQSPPSALPVLSLAQLGLEGPNRYVGEPAAPAAPAVPEASDRVRQSIDESLLKHDRGLGLGAEGPAIAMIEQTVYAGATSVNGRAVLSLVADGMGVVTGVWCSDGDHAQWDAVAAEIAQALQGKRLRRPPGGRGVEMRIEVTSREEMPSGHDPGVEVRVLRIPVKRGRGPQSTRVDLLDIAPKVVIDEMPETAAAPPTWPLAHIEVMKLFATDGDLVDVGAAARRVVHARVLDEHAL